MKEKLKLEKYSTCSSYSTINLVLILLLLLNILIARKETFKQINKYSTSTSHLLQMNHLILILPCIQRTE